jgi:NAD(P)-dependent dehydrogenase (short-subunit alcohol dehydrogenase family)
VSNVIVTGASRGIGFATMEALAARGDRVAAIARFDGGSEHVAKIAEPIALDLSRTEDAERAVDVAESIVGPCSAMVLAAGVAEHAPIEDVSAARIDRHFAINVRAPLLMCRELAKRAKARGTSASIVMVASTLGIAPAKRTSVYAATKGAVIAMTKALAVELAPFGVRVNAIAPGVVDTDMTRALRLEPGEPMPTGAELSRRQDEQMLALAALHPIGHVGSSRGVAAGILYLLDAEDAAGTILVLDGGLTAGSA